VEKPPCYDFKKNIKRYWILFLMCTLQVPNQSFLFALKKKNKIRVSFLIMQPVRLAYRPPGSSTFLSQRTSHQQPASSTFLSEQTSTNHQLPAKQTC
jgi:hypothetical protein